MRVRRIPCGIGFLLVLVALTGCASGGGGGEETGVRPDRNRITLEELQESPPADLLQTVRRLRGRWLSSRGGGSPSVHVDGRFTGGLEVLERIRVADVQEILFRSAADATLLYGTNYPAGVIEVTSRR